MVSLARPAMAASSSSVMSMGRFKGLVVRGAKRGCFAIGAVKQSISGSDTGIRRRFFVQHDFDKHVEGFIPITAALRCSGSSPGGRDALIFPGANEPCLVVNDEDALKSERNSTCLLADSGPATAPVQCLQEQIFGTY